MQSSRKRLFFENFLAYGAINALDKIVPLVMLPLITRLLTNAADYGRFEMFNTIVGFGSSFAILGIYDAMFREYFEKDDVGYRNLVTSTALKIVLLSGTITFLILITSSKYVSLLFLGECNHWSIVIFAACGVISTALRSIISAPTRMRNQRHVYVFSGISYSLIYYLLAFFFIKHGMSYDGMIYGNLLASVYLLLFFYILNRKDFNLKLFDIHILKELLKLGLPLVPVFLIYWAFNSMDKIMIAKMLGMSEVGVYSIGAKVASVSNFIYAAFAGGWQYFAFSTMRDSNQVEIRSKIFEYLAILSFMAYALAIPLNATFFTFFFNGSYIRGQEVFPFLFLSPLLLMLFQTAANQMSILKKTYYSPLCLVVGLVVNLALNYTMIPIYGITGASLATLAGYTIATVLISIVTIEKKLLYLSTRLFVMVVITIILSLTIFFNIRILQILSTCIYYIIIVILYYKDIKIF